MKSLYILIGCAGTFCCCGARFCHCDATRAPNSQAGEIATPCVTIGSVIVSFADKETERLAAGMRVRRFAAVESVARRKLRQLEIAGRLEDLRVPPGNRLEALKGNRQGQMSIRVNDQWRVCFRWTVAGAADVEIVDYH